MTPSLDNVKLCAEKYYIERSQGQCKIDSELGKSDLNNFGNFVELLWHRVWGEDTNFENHVQNSPCLAHLLLSQFRFFFFLWHFVFQDKLQY